MGRFEGVVVFVPLTAPGDFISCDIVEFKKTFATARLVEIKTAGPSRRQAPCPYYGKCGGCNWQHISYEEQLEQKNQMIQHLVAKKWPAARIEPTHQNTNEWRYRRRVQVHAENGKVGFLARGTHDIVDLEDCLIAQENVTAKFKEIRAGSG
ncbi:MAG: TRAM domain-containing protein, partial [Bdellovibrionia bacterium]